MTSILITTANE